MIKHAYDRKVRTSMIISTLLMLVFSPDIETSTGRGSAESSPSLLGSHTVFALPTLLLNYVTTHT